MNSSVPDYKSIYRLQDKTLQAIKGHLGSFYLTGGTALGRFYLNHRFSDDLDFFVNSAPGFKKKLERIADDFLLARDNSLGADKTPIEKAKPKL